MDINQLYEQRNTGKNEALSSMRDYTKELTDLKEGFKAGDSKGSFMFDYAKRKQEGFASIGDLNSLRGFSAGTKPTDEKQMGALFDRLKLNQAEMVGARKTVDERLQAFAGEANAIEGQAAFKESWWKADVNEVREKESHALSIASQAQSMRLREEANARDKAEANNKEIRDRELRRRQDLAWQNEELKLKNERVLLEMTPEDRSLREARATVNNSTTGEEDENFLGVLNKGQQLFNDLVKGKYLSPTQRGALVDDLKDTENKIMAFGDKEATKGLMTEQGQILVETYQGALENQNWWKGIGNSVGLISDAEVIAEAAMKDGAGYDKESTVQKVQKYLDFQKEVRKEGKPKNYFEAKAMTSSYFWQDSDIDEFGGFTDVTAPGEASVIHTENNLEAVKNLTRSSIYKDDGTFKPDFMEQASKRVTVPELLYKENIHANVDGYTKELSSEDNDTFWKSTVNDNGELVRLDETKYAGNMQTLAHQYNIEYDKTKSSLNNASATQLAETELATADIKYFSYGVMPEEMYKKSFGEETYNSIKTITNNNKYINVATMNNSLSKMKELNNNTNLDTATRQTIENGIAMLESRTVSEAMGLDDPNGYLIQEHPDLFGDINYEFLNTPINQLSSEQIAELGVWQGLVTGQDKSTILQNSVRWGDIEAYDMLNKAQNR